MPKSGDCENTQTVELFALINMAGFFERKGIVQDAIPLLARVLDCSRQEAKTVWESNIASAQSWVDTNAANDEKWSVQRAQSTFALLLDFMDQEDAQRASAWFIALHR